MDKRTGLRKSQKRARRDLRRQTKRRVWRGGCIDVGAGVRIRVEPNVSFRDALDRISDEFFLSYNELITQALADAAEFLETALRDSGLAAAAEQREFDDAVSRLWEDGPTQAGPESR